MYKTYLAQRSGQAISGKIARALVTPLLPALRRSILLKRQKEKFDIKLWIITGIKVVYRKRVQESQGVVTPGDIG